jgi:DNA-binding transcriptional LysR family regulator
VLASREVLSLADVGRHPLILYPRAPRPGFIDQMMQMFELRHITPNVSQEVDDLVTAIGLVASGAGLCLVTDSGRTLRIQGTVQIPLRKVDQATVDLCIIHRTGDASPLLADFLAVARSMREHLGNSTDTTADRPSAIPGKAIRKRRTSK